VTSHTWVGPAPGQRGQPHRGRLCSFVDRELLKVPVSLYRAGLRMPAGRRFYLVSTAGFCRCVASARARSFTTGNPDNIASDEVGGAGKSTSRLPPPGGLAAGFRRVPGGRS